MNDLRLQPSGFGRFSNGNQRRFCFPPFAPSPLEITAPVSEAAEQTAHLPITALLHPRFGMAHRAAVCRLPKRGHPFPPAASAARQITHRGSTSSSQFTEALVARHTCWKLQPAVTGNTAGTWCVL